MLQPHHFSYKCPLKISDLDATEGGYYCAKCHKDIHDLTDCSLDEVRELQRRKGSICGFIRAVSVTSMVSLAACSKPAEEAKTDGVPDGSAQPAVEQPVAVERPELMGDICIPEEAPTIPGETPPTQPMEKPPTQPMDPEPEAKADPQKPDEVVPVEIQGPQGRPMIMGIICPPDQLVPKPDAPQDPNREDSPA